MAKSMKAMAADLSLDELRQLLAVKEKLTALEKRKGALEKELAKVNAQIDKLMSGVKKAPVRKRAVKARRKVVKRVAKKAVKKTTRRIAKKTTRKAPAKRTSSKPTVETVVADLIRANGSPMKFQEILSQITSRKLVKTKSKKFDNVLRRTLSTSKLLKRKGRGIYGLK